MNSPFKFLDAYQKKDKDIFFGRDKEIELLYSTSFKTNLMLVYGQSGTGKTSLIQCGLANRFRETDWFDLYIRRRGNINASLHREIREKAETPIEDNIAVTKAIQSLYLDFLKPIYLIFDQFEELFILGAKDEQQEFFKTIGQLLNAQNGNGHKRVSCKIIFIMREEYIARLYDFEKVVSELFDFRIRVEPMHLSNIEEVISKSAAAFKIQLENSGEIIKRIIENNKDKKGEIALPYLQVYLDRLYRKAAKQAQPRRNRPDKQMKKVIFTKDLVEKVGKVSDVMALFLEVQTRRIQGELNKKYSPAPIKVVWEVLNQFATVEGTTLPIPREKLLEKFTGSEEVINDCLEELKDARILHLSEEGGTYEIAHDALARRIDDKRSDEEKALLKIKKMVNGRIADYEDTRTFLSKKELDYIDYYFESLEEKLRAELEPEELDFIEKSRKKVSNRRKIYAFCAAAISLIIFFALFAVRQLEIAEATNFALRAQVEVKEDPTFALRLAEKAKKSWLLDENKIVTETIDKIYWENNFYKIIAKHEASVLSVTFSPKGKSILTGCFDGTVRLWDLKGNGKILEGHKSSVTSAVFWPKRKYILTGSSDRTARLWDRKGNEKKVFKGYRTGDTSFKFSPVGKFILTVSADGAVLLWYLEGNKLLALQDPVSLITSPGFSIDEKYIPTSSFAGKELLTFKGYEEDITSVAFSHDGKYILTGSKDRTARLWDLQGEKLQDFIGHEEEVTSVAFSPDVKDVKYILTGSKDKTARLWDLQGNRLHDFRGHEEEVTSVAFSPDSDYIITGSKDNTIRLWDIKDIKSWILEEHNAAITSAAISPDSKYILTGNQDGTVYLQDFQGNPIQDFKIRHKDDVTSTAFSPDGKYILTGSEDDTARLWDLQGNPIHAFKIQHKDDVTSAAFSHDGKYILTGSRDKTARLWDLQGNPLQTFTSDKSLIASAAFSPDGRYILTGSEYGIAKLWDLKGNPIQVFTGHKSKITSVAFSPPDGKYILTGSLDKTIRLWNRKGEELQTFKGHERGITSAVFSTDGQYILTGSKDKTARLWSLNGMELRVFKGHESWVNSVAFSSNGKYIITGSKDKTVRIWEIKMPLEDFLRNGDCESFSDEQLKAGGIEE